MTVFERSEQRRSLELDLLKGFAIIGVVLYHIGLLSPGFLGVDIFFVINGYLITKGIVKKRRNGDFHYFQWLSLRLLRLWPLISISVLVSLVIGIFLMLPDDLENLGESSIAANFFGINILSAITTKNYWDIGNSFKPLMHLWYVAVLVQCYFIYPLVVLLSYKSCHGGEMRRLWLLLVLCLLSLILCLLPFFSASDKFYYLPFRFYEIGYGGVIALIGINKRISAEKYSLFRFVVCGVLILMMVIPINALSNVGRSLIVTILTGSFIYLLAAGGENVWFRHHLFPRIISCVGITSYSIYIWHQVFFAFYRYAIQPQLGIVDYILLLTISGLIGWISYSFIEKPLMTIQTSRKVFIPTIVVVLVTTVLGGWLYVRAGVVRDVPELNVYTNNIHRGMHAEYCDRVYKMDRPFVNDGRKKILIIGNSFARDFVNVLLESEYKDSVDISYIYSATYLKDPTSEQLDRAKEADLVFIRWPMVLEGVDESKQYGISTKNFGISNGYNYIRRKKSNYYELRVPMEKRIVETYKEELAFWGKDRLVDFIAPLVDAEGRMPIFTDNHKYISQDCRHLTQEGAKYYARILNINEIIGFANKGKDHIEYDRP